MATNTLAPWGLQFTRNRRASSPTYQANQYTIKKTYATKIGLGDVVGIGSGSNQGYIVLAADGASSILGVFAGGLSYFDTNLQQNIFSQWWTGTASPSADVPCLVIDDPDARFMAQVSGGPFVQTWIGSNIDWVYGGGTSGNGNPNIAGISQLALNGSSVANTNTLPFRITGTQGITGGPQDPANTNPWIEVCINTSQNLSSTGV